ncbi:MAG TPA: hypothetical protein VLR49_12800 [Ferruginibacter sp.]|nr:hypothetical protein [Ferruginibacter sp.]
MKQIIYLLAFAFMNVNASAQQSVEKTVTTIDGLMVVQSGDNLQISWKSNKAENANYWEVQASADGITFSVIGLVMGTDPKAARGYYAYKQQTNKIKPGMKYFRVLHMENAEEAISSNTIGLVK